MIAEAPKRIILWEAPNAKWRVFTFPGVTDTVIVENVETVQLYVLTPVHVLNDKAIPAYVARAARLSLMRLQRGETV